MSAWMPREHGLWSWVCLPLAGALLLAPGRVTGAGAALVLVGFGAFNAARRGALGPRLAFLRATGGRAPTAWEVAAILGLAALGGALAIAGGASRGAGAVLASVVGTWHVLGLWWVRGLLAPLLPGRAPWPAGPFVGGALMALTLAISSGAALWPAGLVPLLYLARMSLHQPPSAPREARRVGLTELGWATVALLLTLGATHG